MKLLFKALRRERNTKLVFALLLMPGGLWFSYHYFQQSNLIVAAGMIAMAGGILLMWDVIRKPAPQDEKLWHLINTQPRQIVWIYSLQTQAMPFGLHLWNSGIMYFKLLDGEELTVSLPAGKLKMVSKFLNRLLPHATFGYSEERRQLFEKDPGLLLRNKNK